MLAGVRAAHKQATIPQEARGLPVLGRYDVVVIGGGTSGVPAGIAAARQGAKTLVVENLHGLGGVGTMGAISTYYWGNRVGFTATVPGKSAWVIEQKMEWWRSELLKAGGELWFGCIGCGALVDGGHVCGAVVVTPRGRGVVLAKAVVDATGNADIAAAAGADCVYTDESEFAMQGTGLPPRNLGATYANTDFDITDETDLLDVWHLFVYSKAKFPAAFDQGKLVDTRERRRIQGDHSLTILDEVNERTYPDTIEVAYSNYDTHGYTIDPYLLLEHPEKRGVHVNVPYRCCLPKGLEGILVGGLGLSAHRDALPLVRMQPDMQNLGYALGVAAATSAKSGRLMPQHRHPRFPAALDRDRQSAGAGARGRRFLSVAGRDGGQGGGKRQGRFPRRRRAPGPARAVVAALAGGILQGVGQGQDRLRAGAGRDGRSGGRGDADRSRAGHCPVGPRLGLPRAWGSSASR